MKRISTGHEPLDRVLGGGVPVNSLNIIMGNPGSGKTILAQSILFTNGTPERPALYLSTISEPLSKTLTYLQQLSFATPVRIGTSVLYDTLADVVTEHPERLTEHVEELVQRHRPSVIVMDSFKAIGDMFVDLPSWRRTLHALAGLLSSYAATTFWVGEYDETAIARCAEFAVVDGIIELTRTPDPGRAYRFLNVRKLRGSGFLDGYHAFEIDRSGLHVYPRLVTPPIAPSYEPLAERVTTGIRGLDELVATGWLRGTSTLIAGPSGAGKTVLGLQFLREGLARGERGLLVSFEENPTQLARVMAGFGWNAHELIGSDKIDHFYASPVELQIDTIVAEIFRRVEAHGVRRVVIDAVNDLDVTSGDPRRLRDYLYSLMQWLATRNVTSMFTFSTSSLLASSEVLSRTAETAHLHDNVLMLTMRLRRDGVARAVRITKTRGSAHDGRPRPLEITTQGILVR